MTVSHIEGDLFDPVHEFGGIGHGANMQGQMGAGIAVQFRKLWPDMYRQYVRYCEAGLAQIGGVMIWDTGSGYPSTLFNIFSQDQPGPNATVEATARGHFPRHPRDRLRYRRSERG